MMEANVKVSADDVVGGLQTWSTIAPAVRPGNVRQVVRLFPAFSGIPDSTTAARLALAAALR